MKRLIVHLGLPKTATTTLQNSVFSGLPGYLGAPFPNDVISSSLGSFVREYRDGFDSTGQRILGEDKRELWIAKMERWVAHLVALDEPVLLLSNEGFSDWPFPPGQTNGNPAIAELGDLPRRGPHPVTRLLSELRALLPANVELRTVLVLRNQADWLMSLAAQSRVSTPQFASRLIESDDAFLDQYALVRDLEAAVGAGSHLTLFHEVGVQQNAKAILSFSGYPVPSEHLSEKLANRRQNVRKSGEGQWIGQYRELRVQKVVDFLARQSRLSKVPRVSGMLRPFLGADTRERAFRKVFRSQNFSISMSEDERKAVKEHCRLSTERLAEHLNLDLHELNY